MPFAPWPFQTVTISPDALANEWVISPLWLCTEGLEVLKRKKKKICTDVCGGEQSNNSRLFFLYISVDVYTRSPDTRDTVKNAYFFVLKHFWYLQYQSQLVETYSFSFSFPFMTQNFCKWLQIPVEYLHFLALLTINIKIHDTNRRQIFSSCESKHTPVCWRLVLIARPLARY